MSKLFLWVGRAAGIGGVLLCVTAVVVRVGGRYWLGSFQVGTLFQAGIAVMVAGCLCFLAVLIDRSKSAR
jgi:hypothetical protein